MYKCVECGHIFEDGEEAIWEEPKGEYWGIPCSQEMSGCPVCGGNYEETDKCKICRAECTEDELNGGVCKKCIDDRRKDFNVCCSISENIKERIEINALLASIFDVSEIETILKNYIKENCPDVDCSEFIDSDISWFGEQLVKEVKK